MQQRPRVRVRTFGSGRPSFVLVLKYLTARDCDILVSFTFFLTRVASQKFLCL